VSELGKPVLDGVHYSSPKLACSRQRIVEPILSAAGMTRTKSEAVVEPNRTDLQKKCVVWVVTRRRDRYGCSTTAVVGDDGVMVSHQAPS